MNRDLADIFKDTQKLYSTNSVLVEACKNSKANHKFYGEGIEIECDRNRFPQEAEILVTKSKTFEAAEKYAKNGEKVAVLNFANSVHPGGGVISGARAQEECLCRVSTLYDSLISPEMMEKFYWNHQKNNNLLANDDVIFTPDVVVFKSDTDLPELRPEEEWFKADVMTCAAPCLGWDAPKVSDEEIFNLHESRARQILDVAAQNKADVVILGAFGCGAFSNPPKVVSAVYKKVLADYKHAFKTIEFAVYCRSFDAENYEIFKETL